MVVASNWMLGNADGEEPPSRGGLDESHVDLADFSISALFDRLLDAVVIARLATGRIVLWNPAAEKLFGYSAAEAIGQSLEILMPAPIAQVHRAGLERYLRAGHGLVIDAGTPVEMPARTKNDEGLRVELSLSELQNSRGERFALAVIRDAMHRKHLELTNLELAQARVARSEAQAELAARDELLESVAATLQAEQQPDELRRLADALADFSRVHGGELRVRPRDADLVDLVHAVTDAVRRRATGRRLLVHAPPAVPARFDVARTRQVLEQVMDEAIQRTDDGAPIEIRLEQPSPQTAEVTVRTAGPGWPRELGVGLHLCRTLMQHQGGALATALTTSGGLEVVLTFPGSPHPAPRKLRIPRGR
jgi:two-component system sensor kinase FixL